MPCPCGCNQNLTRRAMQYHRRGQGVPLLVAATMRTSRTLGKAVVPPRLDSTKKFRSSRRYFPEPTSADLFNMELDNNAEDGTETGADHEIGGMDVHDDAAVHHVVQGVEEGVWSGRHHQAAEDEDSESQDDEEGEDADEDEGGCDNEEEYWDDDGNDDEIVGLSARDELGDDFARDAIANGKSPPLHCPNHLLIYIY